MMSPFVASSNECVKCGSALKSGTLNCCARGGAWFKNCGDVGETQFEHTWVEGIQACKEVETSLSVQSPLRFNVDERNTNQLRNTSQHQENIFCADCRSGAGVVNSEVDIGVADVAVRISVLLIVSSSLVETSY